MKKIISILLIAFLAISLVVAQTLPKGINYQAVARDVSGESLAEHSIDLKISLITNLKKGSVVYSETHQVRTNQFGLFNIVIGQGKPLMGDFEEVPWDKHEIWMELAMDSGQKGKYEIMSTTKLLAVPYAFHAGSANQLSKYENQDKVAWWGQPWWNIEGLEKTNPDKHFVGNIDSVDLAFRTNDVERFRIGADGTMEFKGQTIINAQVTGGQSNYFAYPFIVQGSDQGIAIKVNGSRENIKNFLSFWDDSGMHGRIEGQTSSELTSSFEYIWNNTMYALDLAFIIAEGAACGGQLDFAEVAVMAVEGALVYAQWAQLNVEAVANAGIAFESGSGDYAEWLEKSSNEEVFSYGDIVGVRGGKISKYMTDPNHYMVISKSPIVLGNMPQKDQEANYEKVAFMGQVLVKVRGAVNIGDYILASELNDGFGIAVNPQKMNLDQYERIVGVAWSASESQGTSMVNVAVGINANDAVDRMRAQERELASVKNQLNTVVSYLKSKDPSFKAELFDISANQKPARQPDSPAFDTNYTTSNLITVLEENPQMLANVQANARQLLEDKGIDYNRFEQTRKLMTDADYLISVLKENNR